jgi:capsular exopolysaccharide synthesis family protein
LLTLLNLDQNLERQQKTTTLPGTTGDESRQGNNPLNLLNTDYFKAKQDLQLKKAELQEWSEYLKPKHPRIVALNEDIARREKLLEIFKEQSQETLDNRRKSIALQMENAEAEIKEWEVKSLDVSKKMADYERIGAGKKRVQNLYDRLLLAMQSIGVDKDVSPETVTVLERATRSIPARDNPIIVLIIGAAIGLLAALAILLLVDRLDDRPTSFTDLQDLFDEPVMGQIPLVFSANRKEAVRLLQLDDDRHAFLEAYRNLRSSILYMASEGKRPRVGLVTSAIPSDGKSMTAANFAIILALSGSRVVLVDGDMRKGFLHRRFGLEPTPGFNEVLLGQTDWRKAVQPTSTANLSLLPRGNTARNPGEMFLSAASPKLIKELSAEFDYVILDTAPVMAADDVTSLSPQVEGVLFVIRANHTSARVARAALDLLYQREVSVLGLVFNGVETNAAEYYYYRYKDYYHDDKGKG